MVATVREEACVGKAAIVAGEYMRFCYAGVVQLVAGDTRQVGKEMAGAIGLEMRGISAVQSDKPPVKRQIHFVIGCRDARTYPGVQGVACHAHGSDGAGNDVLVQAGPAGMNGSYGIATGIGEENGEAIGRHHYRHPLRGAADGSIGLHARSVIGVICDGMTMNLR